VLGLSRRDEFSFMSQGRERMPLRTYGLSHHDVPSGWPTARFTVLGLLDLARTHPLCALFRSHVTWSPSAARESPGRVAIDQRRETLSKPTRIFRCSDRATQLQCVRAENGLPMKRC